MIRWRSAAVAAALSVNAAWADDEINFDLAELHRSGTLESVEAVIPMDPAYDAPKRYAGYRLNDILGTVADLAELRQQGFELIVTATDGYTIAIPWDIALSGQGVVAVRDLDAPEGADWLTFRHDRREVLPAPFYLVWTGGAEVVPGHYWPYQAMTISIRPFVAAFGAAAPPGADEPVRRGFALFKDTCMSCHSVNLVGGIVGPELNVPRNVHEYWRPEELPAYIRDASAFHARSRMPSFGDMLSDADITAILRYLAFMAGHKVCDSAQSCG